MSQKEPSTPSPQSSSPSSPEKTKTKTKTNPNPNPNPNPKIMTTTTTTNNKLETMKHASILLFGLVALLPIVLNPQDWVFFTLHPLSLFFAFCLMSESILWASKIVSKHRNFYLNVHLILQIATTCAIFFGFYVIYTNKEIHGKLHFQSWHGFLGFLCVIFIFFQNAIGVILYFFKFLMPSSWTGRQKLKIKKYLTTTHRALAVITYTLFSGVILLGLRSNWAQNTKNYIFFESIPTFGVLFLSLLAGVIFIGTLHQLSFLTKFLTKKSTKVIKTSETPL